MSRRLRKFVQLIAREKTERSENDMAGFVVWLRRRSALLKNLETSVLLDIMRHSEYMRVKRDDVLIQQGEKRNKFFLLLRGSASMFVNKYLAAAQRKACELQPSAKSRATISPEKLLLAPKSASSLRKSPKPKSPSRDQVTKAEESDISDAESEVSIASLATKYADNLTRSATGVTLSSKDEMSNLPTPVSKSRASRKETPRAKFGKFIVKYEKGKYFCETAILEDDNTYTATILANEVCDILVLDEEFFNTCIKDQHERETTEMVEFVDIHPFFCDLPPRAKGVLQIALRKHHYNSGDFIVRQEEPVERLYFIVSGSAEVIIEPAKHRYQYPDFWPFETSKDIYFNEFEWLRESRRKAHSKKYEQHIETDSRQKKPKVEVALSAVQQKEVIGITEYVLQLSSFIQSVRCMQPTEVYSLSIKPFSRLMKRRGPDAMDLIRAYVHSKLKFRMEHSLGEKVPLLHCLYVKAEREYREKSLKGLNTKSWEKLRQREEDMLKLLEWFKLDKAALVQHMDVDVLRLKHIMKKKAERRERFRKDMKYENTFKRTGCLAVAKPEREPMSLRALRDPMNEVILKLKMAGTSIRSEQDLEDFLRTFTREYEEAVIDIQAQTSRVTEEEINLLHYRRRGNKLVRRFLHLLSHKGGRLPLTKEETIISNILLEHYPSDDENMDEENLPIIDEVPDDSTRIHSALTTSDHVPTRKLSAKTCQTRKSVATFSSCRTYRFERRSITPSVLESRIRNFLTKYGGKENEISTLPEMRIYDKFEADEPPLPGGKVFVTTVPCMSVWKNVHIKNHKHERCQMMRALPMSKVKQRSPTVDVAYDDDVESISPTTFHSPTTFQTLTSYRSPTMTTLTPTTLRSTTTFHSPVTLKTPTTIRSSAMERSPSIIKHSPVEMEHNTTDLERSPTILQGSPAIRQQSPRIMERTSTMV